jgi:hypothetical protein
LVALAGVGKSFNNVDVYYLEAKHGNKSAPTPSPSTLRNHRAGIGALAEQNLKALKGGPNPCHCIALVIPHDIPLGIAIPALTA